MSISQSTNGLRPLINPTLPGPDLEVPIPGTKVVGTVITLQFMSQREDVASGMGQEPGEPETGRK